MILDWKNWCKLCGNVTLTTNNDYSTDVNNIFKISSYKVCLNCDNYLRGFQKILDKSKNVDKLFKALSKENELYLEEERINELRLKYEVDLLDIKEEDPSTGSAEFVVTENSILLKEESNPNILLFDESREVKTELKLEFETHSDHDYEMGSAIEDQTETVVVEEENEEVADKKEVAKVSRKYPKRKSAAKKYKKPVGKQTKKKKEKHYVSEDPKELEEDPDFSEPDDSEYNEESEDPDYVDKVQKKIESEIRSKIMKERRKSAIPLICQVCDENLTEDGMLALIKHCKNLHDCKPQVMCLCTTSISSFETYVIHKKRCFDDGLNEYVCNLCEGVSYRFKHNLENHINFLHRPEGPRFTCSKCGKSFKTKTKFQKHKKQVACDKEDKRETCTICNKHYVNLRGLKQHIFQVHTETKNFLCNFCSAAFKTKMELNSHLRTHEDLTGSFNFECNVCQKKFHAAYNLKIHMGTHGPVQFFCDHCNLGFKTKNVLKNHIQNVHLSTERNFKCLQCAAAYKNRPGLRNHMLTHNDYNLPCFWCSSIFKKPTIRTGHHKKYHPAEFAEYRKLNPVKRGGIKTLHERWLQENKKS